MRPPRIPPMVTDIVQTALTAFDGVEFSRIPCCPLCGGQVSGYDTKLKRFAVVKEGENERTITVRVRRFTCRNCKSLCYADEPFYPDTRIGAPIIDLFFTLCTTLPRSRAARVIEAMGILVDRTTWRNYLREDFPEIPATEFFSLRLPLSIVTVSTLAAQEIKGGRIEGTEALAACGFPSTHRAPPRLPVLGEEGKQGNEEEEKEERQSGHPEDRSQGQ